MNESTLTLKFKGIEADLLNEMVDSGLFNTKSEAIRAAFVKYSMDLGLLDRRRMWGRIEKFKPRKVAPRQLAKDLSKIKNAK